MMIQSIISYAKELGYDKVYIISGEIGLYEKYGFENQVIMKRYMFHRLTICTAHRGSESGFRTVKLFR